MPPSPAPASGATTSISALTGMPLAIAAMALALGTFMQVLDGTIANVSLTTIAGDLGVSADEGTWIITAFAVANGATVPLTGWLMQRFGLVRTFTVSVLLFTFASLMCGIAWSLPSLVAFRLIQGAVSGPMIPGSQALLMAIFPPERRGTAMAIWSMTALVGPVMGPILGGYISDNFSWGWIFLINVPVGLGSAALTWRMLGGRGGSGRKITLNVTSVALLVAWVGSLQLCLDLGKDADWFASPLIVGLALAAAVLFAAWVIWELTTAHPVVDLALFRGRNFALGTIAFSLAYAMFFANSLLLPQWLQRVQGFTATWAGLVAAPSGVIAVILTPLMTQVARKVDPRWLATLAMASFGVSYGMRMGFTPQTDLYHLILPMIAQGVGMSVFFTALLQITIDGVSNARMPAATGIINFVRITAGGFAASLVITVWDNRETLHQTRIAEATAMPSTAFREMLATMAQHGFNSLQQVAAATDTAVMQSYVMASDDLFRASALLSFALIGIVWASRRARGNSAAAEAAGGH